MRLSKIEIKLKPNFQKWFFTNIFYYLILQLIGWGILSSSQALQTSQPTAVKIRVRIGELRTQVKVRGFDLNLSEIRGSSFESVKTADKTSEWLIHCRKGTIQAQRIAVSPAVSLESLNLKSPALVQTPVGFLHLGYQPFREGLRIYSVNNQCEVINEVDLEKYLDGLVNSEFSSKWNAQAVGAQVIAARTYALFQMKEARKRRLHYDVESSVKDQVYLGSKNESFVSSQIVDKTKGLILTDGVQKQILPIKAFYHSTCGGRTELPEVVWGSAYPVFKRRVNCPYCASSPRFHWTLTLNNEEIAEALREGVRKAGVPPHWPKDALSFLNLGTLSGLDVQKDKIDKRVSQVITRWTKGSGNASQQLELALSGPRFREWIGPKRLLSTSFEMLSPKLQSSRDHSKTQWFFEGRGNGHGVGLCQWGAKVMGEKGYSTAAILKFYYPDAILKKLW